MPIHDQGYRHYSGHRAPHGGAWWVIARTHMLSSVRYRWFIVVLVVAWVPFVVRAVQIYFASTNAQVAQLLREFGWQDILDIGDISTARGPEMMLSIAHSVMRALNPAQIAFKVVR